MLVRYALGALALAGLLTAGGLPASAGAIGEVSSGQSLRGITLPGFSKLPQGAAAATTLSGSITALGTDTISVTAADVTTVVPYTSATAFRVGPYDASALALAVGERVSATESAGVATSIVIAATDVAGSLVGASAGELTLRTAAGSLVTVMLAPGVAVPSLAGGGARLLAQSVVAIGVQLPTGFLAYSVHPAFGGAAGGLPGPQPAQAQILTGTVTAVSATGLTIATPGGGSDTLTLAPATTISVAAHTTTDAILAPGEQATLALTGPGSTTVLWLHLRPQAGIGIVQGVAPDGGETLVRLSEELLLPPPALAAGGGTPSLIFGSAAVSASGQAPTALTPGNAVRFLGVDSAAGIMVASWALLRPVA